MKVGWRAREPRMQAMRRWCGLLVLVSALICAAMPGPVLAQQAPVLRYGVSQDLAWDLPVDHDAIIDKMSAAGVQIVRMDFRWIMIEPANNQWAFALHDQIVTKLRAKGIQVLGLLSHPPSWANGSSDGTVPPINVADWEDFVFQVADHYEGQVTAWEVWNEPNLALFFKPQPDPVRYVGLLRTAFDAIRLADPAATVVLGGLGGNGVNMGWELPESQNFLQAVYTHGGKGYFDAVAIHPYVHPVTVGRNQLRTFIQATRSVLVANDEPTKPIWITEIGWSTAPNAWSQPTITEDEQAAWVQGVFSCQESLGVTRVFWHNFRDSGTDALNVEHNFGLVERDLTSKPAYLRFAARTANLVQNDDFASAIDCWHPHATPDPSHLVWNATNGALAFYRVQPDASTNQATIFQNTGQALPSGTALTARFDLGNGSATRKRISVLLVDADFSDISVCTMWLPPLSPMRPYEMRSHTTKPWANASIYFYAATSGGPGDAYLLDNVVLRVEPTGPADRTDCVDPSAPSPGFGAPSGNLLSNGDFSNAIGSWGTHGQIAYQVIGGVFQFVRPPPTDPAGVILQPTHVGAPAGQIVTGTLALGNASAVRKRVTVLLHDLDFSDLSACTFWLSPGQPLSPFAIRTYTTKAWGNATISIYGATVGLEPWTLLDDVTLRFTPATGTVGTECVEPGAALASPASAAVSASALGRRQSRLPSGSMPNQDHPAKANQLAFADNVVLPAGLPLAPKAAALEIRWDDERWLIIPNGPDWPGWLEELIASAMQTGRVLEIRFVWVRALNDPR